MFQINLHWTHLSIKVTFICFIEKNYEFINTVDMETFVSLYHEDVVVKVNGMHKTTSIVEAKFFGKWKFIVRKIHHNIKYMYKELFDLKEKIVVITEKYLYFILLILLE